MDANPRQSHRKRPVPGYEEDDDDDDEEESLQRPTQKKVRFPKGKKARKEDEISAPKPDEDEPVDCTDPRFAAKERAKRRNQITAELLSEGGEGIDVSAAEVHYEHNGNFEDGGILIEPFNLKQEREEGYFDAAGNFVEYVSEKEVKDAWLDSVEVDTKLAGKANANTDEDEEVQELSSQEIGEIKRRIANTLQPGETVLQALRRLKGISSGKRERMPEETKRIFDQLTEDSMKLMENGDYNVYHEKQEVFQREAEGYERLARARESSTGDSLDMFGDDEKDTSDQPSNTDVMGSQTGTETAGDMLPEGGETQSDYIYDESSGYYYSSSLGYYYDPASGLYCCATSGKWYSFNEQTGEYDEVIGQEAPQAS